MQQHRRARRSARDGRPQDGMVDKDAPMAKEPMAGLKALRDQAAAEAERTQLAPDNSGNQA